MNCMTNSCAASGWAEAARCELIGTVCTGCRAEVEVATLGNAWVAGGGAPGRGGMPPAPGAAGRALRQGAEWLREWGWPDD